MTNDKHELARLVTDAKQILRDTRCDLCGLTFRYRSSVFGEHHPIPKGDIWKPAMTVLLV